MANSISQYLRQKNYTQNYTDTIEGRILYDGNGNRESFALVAAKYIQTYQKEIKNCSTEHLYGIENRISADIQTLKNTPFAPTSNRNFYTARFLQILNLMNSIGIIILRKELTHPIAALLFTITLVAGYTIFPEDLEQNEMIQLIKLKTDVLAKIENTSFDVLVQKLNEKPTQFDEKSIQENYKKNKRVLNLFAFKLKLELKKESPEIPKDVLDKLKENHFESYYTLLSKIYNTEELAAGQKEMLSTAGFPNDLNQAKVLQQALERVSNFSKAFSKLQLSPNAAWPIDFNQLENHESERVAKEFIMFQMVYACYHSEVPAVKDLILQMIRNCQNGETGLYDLLKQYEGENLLKELSQYFQKDNNLNGFEQNYIENLFRNLKPQALLATTIHDLKK